MSSVVGIFAHPDDEAFGPAGTLALLARERDVYLICVTDGGAGQDSDGGLRQGSGKNSTLAEVRREELSASAKALGVKDVHFLDYTDGMLSNNLYHEIADKIETILDRIKPEILITFEPHGITGHIDHIAVSMITSYLFEKLSYPQELWQVCLTEEEREAFGDYYIYFPSGYKKEAITKEIDVSEVWEQKIAAINKHESQKHDMDKTLSLYEKFPKVESFLIRKKS